MTLGPVRSTRSITFGCKVFKIGAGELDAGWRGRASGNATLENQGSEVATAWWFGLARLLQDDFL